MEGIKIEARKIGFLTVLKKIDYNCDSNKELYRCICQCGKECFFEKEKILSGESFACDECAERYFDSDTLFEMKSEIASRFEQESKKQNKKKASAQGEKKRIELSFEQKQFIEVALEGKNVLVDACIGSGKTTAIQELCNEFSKDKKILYLTYNRLLKIDAEKKIKNKNVIVNNYHGYAYMVLTEMGIGVGVSDLIQKFISVEPNIDKLDVLIIDEYQDIDCELATMLNMIKKANPHLQLVAVGDMDQKIYDSTNLDVSSFMEGFLEEHETLKFTNCFRLSKDLAAMLGRVWKKQIKGVNDNCIVEDMDLPSVIDFLSVQDPQDVLCLGPRMGDMSKVMNYLETYYPNKYNKKTLYASVRDSDRKVKPKMKAAIFTTYDSSKGMERPICVVFDFTDIYWRKRLNGEYKKYDILRNIFCVAASRGKQRIIFVKNESKKLSEEILSTPVVIEQKKRSYDISSLFDFKYKEDVEDCFNLLEIKKLPVKNNSLIIIKNTDGLIDLSPCIGIYQEAFYFKKYDIDKEIRHRLNLERNSLWKRLYNEMENEELDERILFLTALNTSQLRYTKQVEVPFVTEEQSQKIFNRLKERLSRDDNVQVECDLLFCDNENSIIFEASGYADVVKEDVVYELKFVSELQHEHFLQCASYMLALGLEKGCLWNTQDNTIFEIMIPDKKKLVDAMVKAVTKNEIAVKGIKLYTQKRFLKMDTGPVWMDQEIVDTEKDKDKEANLEPKGKEMQKVVNVDLTCTTAEAAAMLGVSRSAIYNLIKREELEAKKIRGKYVIEKNSIYKYVEKIEKRQWLTLLISMSIMLGMIIFWILIMSY